MTTPTAVHSNAFNFLGALQSGVDQRTGQYTLSINLPEIKSNSLNGPSLPLVLSFSPISRIDRGFGYGWNLYLTHFDINTQIISLRSGETFKVTEWDSVTSRAIIPEQRLDTFHLYDEGNNQYRVMHLSGEMEILVNQGTVAVPEEFYSAQGQKITLAYTDFQGEPFLNAITDSDDLPIVSIEREPNDDFVHIDIYPFSGGQGQPIARYSMELTGVDNHVTKIHLPSDDLASWAFEYRQVFECLCLEKVTTPTGGYEAITYDSQGHLHPASGTSPLPRVATHVVFPLFDQPPIENHYSYSDENFMGYGAGGFDWDDDGLDNLFKVNSDYTYHSTESLIVEGKAERIIERRFNRYHLLSHEVTTQNDHVHRVIYEYPLYSGQSFYQQMPYCQMPIKVKSTWYLANDINQLRSASTSTTYSHRGNVLSHTTEEGMVELYTYYSAKGEDSEGYFCPPDPEGFVHRVRDKKVMPAPTSTGEPANALLTRYSYMALPSLATERVDTFCVQESETLFEIKDELFFELQNKVVSYFDLPQDPLLHGRIQQEALTLNNNTTTTEYTYTRLDDLSVLEITETIKSELDPKTPLSKTLLRQVSLYTGLLQYTLEGDVALQYSYDALDRLIRQTVAPGTGVEASLSYAYALSVDGTQAKQVVTNADGIETHTYVDGLNRAVRTTLIDPGSPFTVERQTYSALYDVRGNLVRETEHDWIDDEERLSSSLIDYDDWGQQFCVTAADGVQTVEYNDPIGISVGTPPVKRATQTRYTQNKTTPQLISGLTISVFNAFKKPIKTEIYTANRTLISVDTYTYDGFGRCIETTDTAKLTTRFTYDAWSRLTSTTLPDLTQISSEYAAHSSGELRVATRVQPNNHLLEEYLAGEQKFDGFARLTQMTTGKRSELYDYVGGQNLISRLTKANGTPIDYTYDLRVTTQAATTHVAGEELSTFKYNAVNALMCSAINPEGTLTYHYNSHKQMISEKRTDNSGTTWETKFTYSLQGLPLSKTEDNGMRRIYEYDENARLLRVQQSEDDEDKALSVSFAYNNLGQLSQTITSDRAADTLLTVEIEYNDQGQEVLRSQTLNSEAPRILGQTWYPNNLLRTRELNSDGALLLKETFEYDARGRLRLHICEGDNLPKDRYGNAITRQTFRFDSLDNIQRCATTFADATTDLAQFTYDTEDKCRLLNVTHTHPSYPAAQAFEYDDNGNMLNDEQNQRLIYDSQGRLLQVEAVRDAQIIGRYRYDAHNQLITTQVGEQPETLRFYEGNRLSLSVQEGISTHFLTISGQPIGQQQAGDDTKTLVLLTDASHTVVGECLQNQLLTASYTAYGERSSEQNLQSLMAFNGEVRDEASGWYLLGKGYRAYNPQLMRFHSPDSMSPFGAGGLNPYAYCLGNPIALSDPTGHAGSGRNIRPKYVAPRSSGGGIGAWIGVIIGAVLLVATVIATVFFPPVAAMASSAASGFTGALSAVTSSTSVLMAAYAVSYWTTTIVTTIITAPTILEKTFVAIDAGLTSLEAISTATKNPTLSNVLDKANWTLLAADTTLGITRILNLDLTKAAISSGLRVTRNAQKSLAEFASIEAGVTTAVGDAKLFNPATSSTDAYTIDIYLKAPAIKPLNPWRLAKTPPEVEVSDKLMTTEKGVRDTRLGVHSKSK